MEVSMKKVVLNLIILFLCVPLVFAQDPSTIFFDGGLPDNMEVWVWSFADDEAVGSPVKDIGYSPGTSAMRWIGYNQGGWQGIFFYEQDYIGVDMSSIWETDSVYFKLRAPQGLNPSDPNLTVLIYDSQNTEVWDYSVYYELTNFQDLNDMEWHQFAIALKDFQAYSEGMDSTDVIAVSFEYLDGGIATEFYIDEVWIGTPDVSHTMTFYNGQSLGSETWFEAWGFESNDLTLAEGEGYMEGTPAIVWETSNWDYQGMGFIMNVHEMTHSFTADTIKLKIKAPAGINTLALEWYDVFYYDSYLVARKLLDDITWDGEWKEIEIPLSDFSIDEGFDVTQVVEFGVVAADATVPERLLLDDIWLGDPGILIDLVPPPTPENVMVDVSTDYLNLIAWDDIETESGETYDVYTSMNPITDLAATGVYKIESNVEEGEVGVHLIYHPLKDGNVSFYYAVTCTDAAGNPSESFGSTSSPAENLGKKRAIISMEPPQEFTADGDLSEWAHIMPYNMHPDSNLYTGDIADELDYSAQCYVAMDNENLYVAFDVFDDVFSWTETNTQPWWEDEGIEFFIGLYEFGSPHPYFYRGAEPDYRLLFLPDKLELWSGDSLVSGTADYLFEPLGNSDYIIEAKIPFSKIQVEGDSTFAPMPGMTIPFEIFGGDADVTDGGNKSRLQLGDNAALNPWGAGPEVWTFAWIGLPSFLAIEDESPIRANTYYLGDNYPNPFNPTTTIEYAIAQSSQVELVVYNSLGQRVKTLVNEHQSAGHHMVSFDATDLASGVYFYKISSEKFTQVKKMLLIK